MVKKNLPGSVKYYPTLVDRLEDSDIQGMVTVPEIGTILGEIGPVVEMVTGDPPSDSC